MRLLVDAFGNAIPKAILAHLIEEGVEVKLYNPARGRNLLNFRRLHRRLHDKLLVVDDEEMVVGGRNITEGYFGMRDKRQFHDLDTYVSGPAATAAKGFFRQLWDAPHVMPPARLSWVSRANIAMAKESLDHYDDVMAQPRFLALLKRDWRANTRTLTSARFVHDPVDMSQKSPRTIHSWKRLFASAKKEIVLITPYLIPTKEVRSMIRHARARGVTVKIFTNSRRSGERWTQAAYELYAPVIARMGVEIWEFDETSMLHAKSVLVDGKRAYVGSYNTDPRSQRFNTETGAIMEGPELAADLARFAADLQSRSRLVAHDGKLDVQAWRRHTGPVGRMLWPIFGGFIKELGIAKYL